MGLVGTTYSYCPVGRSPVARLRRWWWLRTRVADRSDGRDYTGWTARVVAAEAGMPPVGTEGPVIGSEQAGGEVTHIVDFETCLVRAPLPRPSLRLIPPHPQRTL
ncbi:MAG: hypothetical protein ACRDTT_07785 [Pseudonocardiaceae bacterium]